MSKSQREREREREMTDSRLPWICLATLVWKTFPLMGKVVKFNAYSCDLSAINFEVNLRDAVGN